MESRINVHQTRIDRTTTETNRTTSICDETDRLRDQSDPMKTIETYKKKKTHDEGKRTTKMHMDSDYWNALDQGKKCVLIQQR